MCSGGTVPEEIVTEVLYRLPVKSLCRFKCVSRSWKTLISDPHFAKAHLNRTNTSNPKQFVRNIIFRVFHGQDLYSVNLAADVPIATKLYFPSLQQPQNHWADVFGYCNGLLLFSDEYGNPDSSLLNPSTKECKKLPTPPLILDPYYHYGYGVGYDSSKDDYKVVMLSYYDNESESEYSTLTTDITFVAVYSLKTNAWRRIQDTHYRLVEPTSSVYSNGCVHWLCWRASSYLMVAFDLADEIFREVPMPALVVYDDLAGNLQVVIVGDCLCLVYRLSSSKIEVWTMKEYGVGASWTKIMIDRHDMNLGIWGRVLAGLLGEDEFVLSTMGKILPRGTKNQVVVYNPKKGTLRDIVIRDTPTNFIIMGTYVESLVSPNQCYHGGGIGKQG